MKEIIFNKELTENEKKTLSVLIEIKNGVPNLVSKRLKDICVQTQIARDQQGTNRKDTDKGYQLRVLKDLRKKGIVDKDKNGYFIKKKYMDIALGSFIQNKIENLEEKGIFHFSNANVLGIKKDWCNPDVPEYHYLYQAIHDSLPTLYRIKQLKAICLLRDFSKQWKIFLTSDVPPEVKYYVWLRASAVLEPLSSTLESGLNERGEDEDIDEKMKLLDFFGVTEETKKKFKTSMVQQNKDFIVSLRKQSNYEPFIPESFSQRHQVSSAFEKKISEWSTEYHKLAREFIENELTEKQKKIIKEIKARITETSNEINNVGVYVDIGKLTRGVEWGVHCEIPVDDEKRHFAKKQNMGTLKRMQDNIKDLKIETIEEVMENSNIIYNWYNIEHFRKRFTWILFSQITKPKQVFFSSPELKRIMKEIKKMHNLEKKEITEKEKTV